MAFPEDVLLNNRYRVIGSLGQGGMGAVYHAIDESLGVEVAVKENKIDDEDYNRQFKREANILANMRHPNLPRVTDHFVTEDGQYLVMDFIEGEDLRERLERDGPLLEKEAMVIGVALCDALSYLHTQDPPILHRDIKPGNIKVTPSGHVFLVDFGLAKIDQDGSQTTTGARGLTPGYSPPEQYGTARTDSRSDVYALGGTLYALLTGHPPEDGLSIAIEQTTLTHITERKPDTSSKLASVIEKALEIKSENRFQTAAEFKHALLDTSDTVQQRVAMGEMTVAPPPPQSFSRTMKGEAGPVTQEAGTEVVKPPRKKWGLAFSFVGILALLAVVVTYFVAPQLFGGVVVSLNVPTDEPAAIASLASTDNSAGGATDVPTSIPADVSTDMPTEVPAAEIPTVEDTPTMEPTATETPKVPQIAYASIRSGDIQIWMMTLGGLEEPEQLTFMSGGACQPDWSPDGTYLVFISPCNRRVVQYPQAEIWLLDVAGGGEPERISDSVPGDFDPAWSPDGTLIAFTSLREGNMRLFQLDFETRKVSRMTQPNTQNAQPYWSPDGKYMVFILANEIYVLEVGTNRALPLTSNTKTDTYPAWSPAGDVIVFMQGSPQYIQFVRWPGTIPPDPLFETRLVPDAMPMRDPDFSADGTQLVFSSNAGGDGTVHDLYIVDASGSNVEKITNDEYLNFHPAWRPIP